MSIRSMTGFGCGEAASGGITVVVELSSVNRKQFDLRLNLPRPLATLESQMAKLVRTRVSRGCVKGTVRVSTAGKARRDAVRIDMDAATAYVKALREAGRDLDLVDDLSLNTLARLPEVVCFQDMTEASGKIGGVVKRALQDALKQLVAMREAEGDTLVQDLEKRFAKLEKRAVQIQRLAPNVPVRYRKALKTRIAKADLGVSVSDEQLAREIVVFADRCDISEELVRLTSHFKQASKLMRRREPAGRAFDFLCQELLREINTIGSKANDAALSRHVISFKTELECIREQVQNIE